MNSLKKLLDKEIDKLKGTILKDVAIFAKSNKSYWNRPYGEDIIVIFRKSGGESYKSIGFPFPLLTYKINFVKQKNVSIMIFLTGEPVIVFQRNQLLQELKNLKKDVRIKEISSLEEFRSLTKKVMESKDSFNYYDPYSFIGDSFIGLHFAENIEKTFRSPLSAVHSENYQQLKSCITAKGYLNDFHTQNKVHVFADLIANQWDRTKHLVKKVTSENKPSLIIGRDLIINPNKNHIEIFHYNRNGILLKKENIEVYMDKCLYPFLNPLKKNEKENIEIKSNNIILNPFGSNELKTIPVEIVLNFIKKYKAENPDAKILIISGFKHNYSHLIWTSKLRAFLLDLPFKKDIILKNYGSFFEIKKDILKYGISIGITSDTSIAHFFNYLNLLNITLYNLDRVDTHSVQSLASDSPLGFCRYKQNQFPVLFSHKSIKKIGEGILECVRYFTKKSNNTSWARKIFDDKILIKDISQDQKELLDANMKINPLWKIK